MQIQIKGVGRGSVVRTGSLKTKHKNHVVFLVKGITSVANWQKFWPETHWPCKNLSGPTTLIFFLRFFKK
jgi:hypothetical protein